MTPPATPPFPRSVAVLGATGSIGRKALAVAARYPDRIRVASLAAHRSVEELAAQARRFSVPRVAIADPERLGALKALLPPGVSADAGPDAVAALARDPRADVVLNGIVGRAGLEASLAAASAGKLLALANKESLVLAGELLMRTAAAGGARVLPVDSEHSGLHQCLDGRPAGHVRRLLITASGGPFRGKTPSELERVTPEEALRHPVWAMGPRITVDSATLFNKGLEVIETHVLFGFPLDRIDVWIHPESVVHALVELADGSLIAQASAPDMALPVQYALTYPERWSSDAPFARLPDWGALHFHAPDDDTFPAIRIARRASERGGTAPAVLNAADEVAVDAFLRGRIPFPAIIALVEAVLEASADRPAETLDDVARADREAREAARELLAARSV